MRFFEFCVQVEIFVVFLLFGFCNLEICEMTEMVNVNHDIDCTAPNFTPKKQERNDTRYI